jgi:hypothetical protein
MALIGMSGLASTLVAVRAGIEVGVEGLNKPLAAPSLAVGAATVAFAAWSAYLYRRGVIDGTDAGDVGLLWHALHQYG